MQTSQKGKPSILPSTEYFGKKEITIKPCWITVDETPAIITKVMNTSKGSIVRCYATYSQGITISMVNQKGVWYDSQNEVWTNKRTKDLK